MTARMSMARQLFAALVIASIGALTVGVTGHGQIRADPDRLALYRRSC